MPDSWREVPLTAGLLATIILGVGAILVAGQRVQSWIDDRTASHVAPIETQVDTLQGRMLKLQERVTALEERQQKQLQMLNSKVDELPDRIERRIEEPR